ncbi:hypothetical protein [Bradyrhizobium sp. CCBAU 53415]|uniref:hypothetical protein n=1 Tax=Bradyrhizobium sp. CCBAU 53415 TaxID=1325119 RepID=UPI002305E03C|nr:hypothetical protein [Bradyrhizobium sp. CCBAU 53415]
MQDDPEQSRAFIEKAPEIEGDEERSAGDELMKRLAKTHKQKADDRRRAQGKRQPKSQPASDNLSAPVSLPSV